MKVVSRIFLLLAFCITNIKPAVANENYELAIRAFNQQDIDAAYIYLKNSLADDGSHLPSKILIAEILIYQGFVHQAIIELEDALEMGVDKNLIIIPLIQSYLKTQNIDALFDLDPSNLNGDNLTELLLARAHSYHSQSLLVKAEKDYLRLLSSGNQKLRVTASLASFYIDINEFKKAQDQIDRVGEISENNSIYYHLKGRFLAKKGDHKKAVLELERALELAPTEPLIKRALASQLMKASEFNKAEKIIADILVQTPDDPYALLFQARLLASNSQNEVAQATFESISQKISIFNDDVIEQNSALQLIQGITNYLTGNLESATTSLESYISKGEPNANALGMLADTYLRLGESRRAQALLDRHYEISSTNINLGSLLCELYLDASKVFKCEQLLGQLKFRFPESSNLPLIEVKLSQAKGQYYEALNTLTASYNLDNLNTDLSLLYITLLRQSGDNASALEYVEQLIQRRPENLGLQAIKANLLIARSDFKSADTINKTLLENNPSSITASLNQARILLAQGRSSDAKLILDAILERDKKNYDAALLLAAILTATGPADDAEIFLQDLAAVHNDKAEPLKLLTSLYLQENQLDKALSIANKLTRDYFLNKEFIRLKASVHLKLNQLDEVNKQYNLLLGLAENDFVELIKVASLQSRAGLVDQAITTLEQSLTVQDDNYAKRELLKLSLGARDTERVNNLLKELSTKYPSDSTIVVLQGDSKLLIDNKPNDAAAFYSKALSLNPRNAEAAAKLYQVVRKHPDTSAIDFEQHMLRSLNEDSQLLLHRNLLADYLLSNEQGSKAKSHYQMLIDYRAPNLANNLNNLANIYAQELDFNKSKALAQQAHELNSKAAYIKNTLGNALFELGETQEALNMLRQAFTIDSQSAFIRFNLARTLASQGRKDEAISIMQGIDMKDVSKGLEAQLSDLLKTLTK